MPLLPLWLTLALCTAPNLLPGNTSGRLGLGALTMARAPDEPAFVTRAEAGGIALPTPGERRAWSASLGVERPVRLDAGLYTLACTAAGAAGGERLELAAAGQQAVFDLSAASRTCQLTFRVSPDDAPLDAWPTLRAVRHAGVPSRLRLADVRLVAGADALAADSAGPSVDVSWGEALGEPLWRTPAATVTVSTDGVLRSGVCHITDPAGRLVREAILTANDEPAWHVPVGDLPTGFYRVEARLDGCDAAVSRWLPLLADLHDGPRLDHLSFDAAAAARSAEARALGAREVRRVVTWAELVGADGSPDFAALDNELAPAFAAGMEVTLALAVTPASSQPKGAEARDGLPALDRCLAFVSAVAGHFARRGVTYEIDPDAWHTWRVEDQPYFDDFLTRVAAAISAADASARLSGLGFGFDLHGGAAPVAFFDQGLWSGVPEALARVPVHLPGDLGAPPDRALGVGLGALFDLVGERWDLLGGEAPVWQIVADAPPCGPLEADPLRPTDAVSPWQLAARTARAWLLAKGGGTVIFPSGWRGEWGPREAALNRLLARFDGARWVGDVDLGTGLEAIVLRGRDGRGLAAVSAPGDARWSAQDAPPFGLPPRLVLPAGTARATTLYGTPLDGVDWPLSFEPLLMEADSPARLTALLEAAKVSEHRQITASWRLAVRDQRPGMMVHVVNGSRAPAAGEGRLFASSALATPRSFAYRLGPRQEQDLFIPFGGWLDGARTDLGVRIEAGDELAGGTRALWSWPTWRPAPPPDASDETWPLRRADTAGRVMPDSTADWLGPDDCSMAVRGDYRDGAVTLVARVDDDQVTAGDLLDVYVKVDPSVGNPDGGDVDADYRVRLRPLVDGKLIGGREVQRLNWVGPALLDEAAMSSAVSATPTGWRVVLRLPLTAPGRAAVEAQRVIGLEMIATDVDAGKGPTRLVLLGDRRDPLSAGHLAQVWLAQRPVEGAMLFDVGAPAPEPAARIAFGPRDTQWRLTPDGFGRAEVHLASVDDWLRGDHALRVTPDPAHDAEVARLGAVPGVGPRQRVELWARARAAADGQPPPRLGARVGQATIWFQPPPDWHRLTGELPAGAVSLVFGGAGTIEVAEADIDRAAATP